MWVGKESNPWGGIPLPKSAGTRIHRQSFDRFDEWGYEKEQNDSGFLWKSCNLMEFASPV